ncbi:MAG: 2-oxoglutarate and iron-dependent oxygenase domain-containing protein, partial [Pseudomonadota bacterium]
MSDVDFAAARQTASDEIPVIDIAPLMAGGDIANVASQLHQAATGSGFFYVAGHGIDDRLIDQAFGVARDFFALPVAAKQTVAIGQDQRGWMATGLSRLEGSQTHDLKEVFFWGREVRADDLDLKAGLPLVAANRWPDDVFPRLRSELLPYYDAACGVGARLMQAIAVSLGQAPDVFAAAYARPLARGQLVYYPPSQPADEDARRFGVAPHTDFGVLTLLLQDSNGGLQVRASSSAGCDG